MKPERNCITLASAHSNARGAVVCSMLRDGILGNPVMTLRLRLEVVLLRHRRGYYLGLLVKSHYCLGTGAAY